MKYFSTFSGIGGFEIGIHNAHRSALGRSQAYQKAINESGQGLLPEAGEDHGSQEGRSGAGITNTADKGSLRDDNQSATTLEHEREGRNGSVDERSDSIYGGSETPLCIGYSEIDKYASSVYEHNFPGTKNYGDITKINADELPDFDCLVGGFPCQAFSIAGKRKGFEDTRGTLFFDLARILRAKTPRLFVFENVKGLLSHDNGNTFKTIIATINELGYDCQWQVLNSKNHGVPQNRERIYIVGHLRGTPRPEVFPLTREDLQAADVGGRHEVAIPVLTPDRIVKRQNGRRFKEDGEPAFTVNTQDRHGILQLNNPARERDRIYSPGGISPALSTMQGGGRQPFIALSGDEPSEDPSSDAAGVREASGLSRQLDGSKPVSDTQRYKMAGNAVTTNVVQAVFERILPTTP